MTLEIIASHQIECKGVYVDGGYANNNPATVPAIIRTFNDPKIRNMVNCPNIAGEHKYRCSAYKNYLEKDKGEEDLPICPYSNVKK